MSRERRQQVADENRDRFFPELLRDAHWGPVVRSAIFRTALHKQPAPAPPAAKLVAPHVYVVRADTLVAARALVRRGRRVCVLNFASSTHPGGGYESGAAAQEESLCRSSMLYAHLTDCLHVERSFTDQARDRRRWYPLPEGGGIFAPDVLVFRDAAERDWAPLARAELFTVDVVTVAALRRPQLVRERLSKADYARTQHIIRGVLRLTLNNTLADALVLGAFGCGAYGNPPEDVAAAFDGVLREPEFFGKVPEVAFAVVDPQGTDNYEAFRAVFGEQP